jgi:glycosyltransferase involved in cell wall biosynthesis
LGRGLLRILYLSYYYLPHVGGGTWTTYNLSSQLASRGHSVDLVTPNVVHSMKVSDAESLKLEVANPSRLHRTPRVKLPWSLGPPLSVLPVFVEALRHRRRYDVIVSQHHPHHLMTCVAVLLGRVLGVPVVVRADDTYREMQVSFGFYDPFVKTFNAMNESLLRRASMVLVATSESRVRLSRRLGGKAPSFGVGLSPNGIDLRGLESRRDGRSGKEELGLPSKGGVVLFTGHFAGKQYGVELLLKALAMAKETVPGVGLLLVGDDLPPAAKSLVSSLGLDASVRTYPPQPPAELYRFIDAADVCVGPLMPTQALPLKVLEYMACGKPVMTGIHSVTKDLAVDGFNCVVVSPEPSAIAKALVELLADGDRSAFLGSNASRTALTFTWERISSDFEVQLFEVLRQWNAPPKSGGNGIGA